MFLDRDSIAKNTGANNAFSDGNDENETHHYADKSKVPVKVNIIEPLDRSYIAGSIFHVSIEIFTADEQEAFEQSYINNDSSRVCLSLDDGL